MNSGSNPNVDMIISRLSGPFVSLPNAERISRMAKKADLQLILLLTATVGIYYSVISYYTNIWWFVFGMTLLPVINSIKTYSLYKRYAIDLEVLAPFGFTYGITQSLLSTIIHYLGLAVLLSFFLVDTSALISIPFLTLLCIIGIMFYARVSFNLPFAASVMGLSIIPALDDFTLLKVNFNRLRNIKGKRQEELVISRVLLVSYFAYLQFNHVNPFYTVLTIIAFIYLNVHWERTNASALLMKSRADILKQSPADLPSEIEDRPIESKTFKPHVVHTKQETSSSYLDTPTASVSKLMESSDEVIRKLARKIQEEEAEFARRKLICKACNFTCNPDSTYCRNCGTTLS